MGLSNRGMTVDSEPSYVERQLEERDVASILSEVKEGLRNGNLLTPMDKEYAEKALEIDDFQTFREERRTAYDEYDGFCSRLENELEAITQIEDPYKRIEEIYPLFQQVLDLDARRRAFDAIYDDDDSIIWTVMADLESQIEQAVNKKVEYGLISPSEIEDAKNRLYRQVLISPQPSFESQSLLEYTAFLEEAPEETIDLIEHEGVDNVAAYLEDHFGLIDAETDGKLAELYEETARSHMRTLAKRLKMHGTNLSYSGEEEIRDRFERNQQDRAEAIERVASSLGDRHRFSFMRRVRQLSEVYGFISEDSERHANLDAISDFFLREEAVKALAEIDVIEDESLSNHPQMELLEKCEAVLDGDKRAGA